MFAVHDLSALKKCASGRIVGFISPGRWVGDYESFAEAVLKGEPYNRQVWGFIYSKDYCPEDYRAVDLIQQGHETLCEYHWNSALKIVCRNAWGRANGKFRPDPTPHERQLGQRAKNLWYSVDSLSDLSSSSDDSDDSDSEEKHTTMPGPLKLTRQCAVNPELQNIHRLTLEAELNIARDTNYYKSVGMADLDCDTKWDKTLQELRHSGDLIMPTKAHSGFYQNTKQWYKTFKLKSLKDILQRPLRFPIELLVNPNGIPIISQRPVAPTPPVSNTFRPITPPQMP